MITENAIRESINPTFFYVLSSNDFSDQLSQCSGNYGVGFINKRTVVSNRSLFTIKQKYDTNYEGLKNDLGIPSNVDFSLAAAGYLMETSIPLTVEVVAKTYYEPVLYSNGSLIVEKFTIKIW
jgi:hypothetical protein